MWWGRDFTGRFPRRPFYKREEIEVRAAEALQKCAEAASISIEHPLTDEILEILADYMTERFDISSDTTTYGVDVDGFTVFARHGKPSVVLNRDLAAPSWRLRRRFTIAHELGHVVLHQPLYERDERQLDLLVRKESVPVYCAKKDIERSIDWCEWQAGYFAGALLIPGRELNSFLTERAEFVEPLTDGTTDADRLIARVSGEFDVSRDAARVRMLQVGTIKPVALATFQERTA